ncbi:MAG TPA: protein-L-isoaspartate(D-aspartate) O-methyltransferase [Candidatus Omnitrophota bacterium]|nr:protein-L-isoaspartate(D-aspartate) O-methyltransferase [Candidatus Omnitrophota bacterium]HPD85284.1 protein-L-isoaspartate(D-aspartate) O-methyltransferase [Candidatus Omnitrophota bacterium]HRZ04215.1 protein-L-isoaspartate(D-aspartate) O-methyltransferase [Candidatus Omnitrophota bacterium]
MFTTTLFLCASAFASSSGNDPFFDQRMSMVEAQIKQRGILDPQVLAAMLKVQRHLFVPEKYQSSAYEDYPLSIGHEQTISQPYIVAYMTEAAKLHKGDTVLEIGTGSGYQAAILAEIVGKVYTVELIESLADTAQKRLKDLGYQNIFVKQGDGYQSWKDNAPYDAIIVTAAPDSIPNALIDQLKPGGRMVIPVGSFHQELYLVTKTESGIDKKLLLPVRFVPMVKPKED